MGGSLDEPIIRYKTMGAGFRKGVLEGLEQLGSWDRRRYLHLNGGPPPVMLGLHGLMDDDDSSGAQHYFGRKLFPGDHDRLDRVRSVDQMIPLLNLGTPRGVCATSACQLNV